MKTDPLMKCKKQLEALSRITFTCKCCGSELSLSLYGGDNTCLLCKESINGQRAIESTNLNSKKNE